MPPKSKKKEEEPPPEEPAEEAEPEPEGPTEGKGSFVFPDGSKYDGDWVLKDKKKLRHGYGVFIDGEQLYEGEWVEDKMQGEGGFALFGSFSYDLMRDRPIPFLFRSGIRGALILDDCLPSDMLPTGAMERQSLRREGEVYIC